MITFDSVSKIYAGIPVLENINFNIEKGEFIFLMGNSGSGKTTIIKLLIRQEDPTEGNILFNNINILDLKGGRVSQLRRQISVVFQDFKLLKHKNVAENIGFVMEVAGKNNIDITETVPHVLKLVNLESKADFFPDQLSGGEKQKVAIARALASDPHVLIADEPTGNLDQYSSSEIIEILEKVNNSGTTVIMATHDDELTKKMNKRIIKLENGHIIEIDGAEEPSKSDKKKVKIKTKDTGAKDQKIESLVKDDHDIEKSAEKNEEKAPVISEKVEEDFEAELLKELDEEAAAVINDNEKTDDSKEKEKKEEVDVQKDQVSEAPEKTINIKFSTKNRFPYKVKDESKDKKSK